MIEVGFPVGSGGFKGVGLGINFLQLEGIQLIRNAALAHFWREFN